MSLFLYKTCFLRKNLIYIFLLLIFQGWAQNPVSKEKDSINDNPFKTGFYPVGFFDIDLRYLIKYNDYEGFRLGFGGTTNKKLSNTIRLGGYAAYGFKDHFYKYSIEAGVRIQKKHKAWANISYTNDIQEVASHIYLTDKFEYSIFEPRLLNIKQFYKHKTWEVNFQNNFIPSVLSEVRISNQKIENILNYGFISGAKLFKKYSLTEIIFSTRISFNTKTEAPQKTTNPIISAQISKGIKNMFGSDFNYTKLGLKVAYQIARKKDKKTSFVVEGNWANGEVPLTHLFHAYPNSPTKDEILQRFSVTGTHSFETMYFGEFFSDKLATLQVKHTLFNFNIGRFSKPELLLVTRHAIGSLSNPQNHTGLTFKTLDNIYSESGIELNQLLFGFGLSFNYRYGYYHLSDIEDNISFKFTFLLKI